jgi:hypothetical protein
MLTSRVHFHHLEDELTRPRSRHLQLRNSSSRDQDGMILLFDYLERCPEDHIIHFIQDYICGVQGHLWRLLRMIPYNECLSSQTELVVSERQNHCIYFYKCIFYQWNRFTVSGGRMKEGGGYGFSEAFILFRGFPLTASSVLRLDNRICRAPRQLLSSEDSSCLRPVRHAILGYSDFLV